MMEMQINKDFVKQLRAQKAWSQTELAQAAGLSLRTIQRIEKTGLISLESTKALAAVFELSVSELQEGQPPSLALTLKRKVASIAAVFTVAASGFVLMPASADPIMVDLDVLQGNKKLTSVQLLNEEHEVSEIKLSDKLTLRFSSEMMADDQINIATEIFQIENGTEHLLASPVVKTKHRQTAEIHFADYALLITPNR